MNSLERYFATIEGKPVTGVITGVPTNKHDRGR
jgi:hypothetical protein